MMSIFAFPVKFMYYIRETVAVHLTAVIRCLVMVLCAMVLLCDGKQASAINLSLGCPYLEAPTGSDQLNWESEQAKYPDTGKCELTNGVTASESDNKKFSDPDWVGWFEQDVRVVTIDLTKPGYVSSVDVDTCQSSASSIYFPEWVDVSTSLDGKRWSTKNRAINIQPRTVAGWYRQVLHVNLRSSVVARYIQVAVPAFCWVFVDEISVNGTSIPGSISSPSQLSAIVREKRGLLGPVPNAHWLKQGAPSAGGARNIILIYSSGDPAHPSKHDAIFYRTFAMHLDTKMQPDDRFFDTFLFLPLPSSAGGTRQYYNGTAPSISQDWSDYLDQLFYTSYQLQSLNMTSLTVCRYYGASAKLNVIIAIPYPSRLQTNFGDPYGTGVSLDFSDPVYGEENRRLAVKWYIDSVLRRWRSSQLVSLNLLGFYWYAENAPPSDAACIQNAAAEIHSRGYRFFWIPYFQAPGFQNWKEYGFDAPMMQPNAAFRDGIPYAQCGPRLRTTAELAKKYGMGMEIEIGYDLNSQSVREKYMAYLNWGRKLGYQKGALLSYYQSVDMLLKASQSYDPMVRDLYDATYRFVKGMPGP